MSQREHWDSRTAFILATIGSAVGLGNVWRFPYICYANGGGAFLIPYFVALFTAGIPLMMLELSLGHKFLGGAPQSMSPLGKNTKWIGWFAIFCGLTITTYYAVIMAWSFDYLYYSIKLSWSDKPQEFFFNTFLKHDPSSMALTSPNIAIIVGLVLTWLAIYFSIFKGVKSVSKVVMITVPVPILLIFIFVIRGITLPGSLEGLAYYLKPDFAKLLDWNVWIQAYGQVFFSLSLGFGILMAYASFLPKKSDITNNAFIISLSDAAISFTGGVAVFTTLGYLAFQKGVPIADVVASGPGLAFVTYPTIISLLPFWAQFFGVLFFLMLLTLAIDSAFSIVESIVCAFSDEWNYSRERVVFWSCLVLGLLGIIYTGKAGLNWLDLVDHYVSNFGLVLAGLLECIAVGWIYGPQKVREYFNSQSDFKVGVWWDICIKIITPIVLTISIVMVFIERIKQPYGGYPQWAQWVGGWGMLLVFILAALLLMKVHRTRETSYDGGK